MLARYLSVYGKEIVLWVVDSAVCVPAFEVAVPAPPVRRDGVFAAALARVVDVLEDDGAGLVVLVGRGGHRAIQGMGGIQVRTNLARMTMLMRSARITKTMTANVVSVLGSFTRCESAFV